MLFDLPLASWMQTFMDLYILMCPSLTSTEPKVLHMRIQKKLLEFKEQNRKAKTFRDFSWYL
jgi:hypothetical protein